MRLRVRPTMTTLSSVGNGHGRSADERPTPNKIAGQARNDDTT